MNLAVFSHKNTWRDPNSQSGYSTDGGFPLQMAAIAKLFSTTRIVVPCDSDARPQGLTPLAGNGLKVVPLTVPRGTGIGRKLGLIAWLLKNGGTLLREVRRADAIHAPIPGDIGSLGMLLALALRKPLFVRHCGNWTVPRTTAERFWKWSIERWAGGRNVMLATGGGTEPPSRKNPNIKWIFSTSLAQAQIDQEAVRTLAVDLGPRLIIACRQEQRKGTDVVIEAMTQLVERHPDATLDVIGDGSMLPLLRRRVAELKLVERVRFHGKVPQSSVPELMKQADIFCYPTSASEGFPKVVLEALASGLPVITTSVSVLPHLISSGCGVILDDASPNSLAAAVESLVGDPKLYARMSEQALVTASAYTLENWGDFIGKELRRAWKFPSFGQAQADGV